MFRVPKVLLIDLIKQNARHSKASTNLSGRKFRLIGIITIRRSISRKVLFSSSSYVTHYMSSTIDFLQQWLPKISKQMERMFTNCNYEQTQDACL